MYELESNTWKMAQNQQSTGQHEVKADLVISNPAISTPALKVYAL
jgi:hypothetical protein